MRFLSTTGRLAVLGLTGLALAGVLTACGDSSDGTTGSAGSATPGGTASTTCDPVAGDSLVTLADDKKLQLSDNVLALVRTPVAKPPLTDALNKVASVLTQEKLIALNAAASGSRQPVEQVAEDFVKNNGLDSGFSGGSGTINIVAANFSESQILANIYKGVLQKAGYDAKVNVSTNREAYLAAMKKGQYDVVPEYAATLTEFLNAAANGANAAPKATPEIDQTIAALKPLAAAQDLTALEPAEATDQNAFAVTSAFASKYGVKTLSELATRCSSGISLGGAVECPTRSFCQIGLEKTYGLKTTFTPLDSDGSLTRSAVQQGKVALVLVFSSDSDVKPAG